MNIVPEKVKLVASVIGAAIYVGVCFGVLAAIQLFEWVKRTAPLIPHII